VSDETREPQTSGPVAAPRGAGSPWSLQYVALLFLALTLGSAVERYLAPSVTIAKLESRLARAERERSEALDRAAACARAGKSGRR